MALGDVSFIKDASSLGTPANGEDYISGLVFYGDAPALFPGNRMINIFSLEQAEAYGITTDYSDETKGKGKIKIDVAGDENDTISAVCYEPTLGTTGSGTNATIGEYTVLLGDTANDIAAGLNAAINALTYLTGYTSTVATDTVTITYKAGLGVWPNTGPFLSASIYTPLVTMTATVTNNFVSGVASKLAVYHYHISEFFRANPTGQLFVGVFAIPATFDGTEITTLQVYAQGKMRQVGVYYVDDAFDRAQVTALQLVYDANYTAHMPVEIYYGGDFSNWALTSLADLGTLDAENVHVILSQDGSYLGSYLYYNTLVSITTLGNALGDTSAAKVSENIGWRNKFPNSNGYELEVIAFGNGDLYTAQSTALLTTLDNYHYMFLVKNIGLSGSFYNDTFGAVTATSDYSRAERNRTIDKAIRNIRTLLLPSLNAPLYVNADGTLTNSTIAYFKAQAETPLATMQSNGEIGAPPDGNGGGLPAPGYKITIDATQNVISTSKLVIGVKLIPVGLAKFIEVNIGFTLSI